MLLNVCSICTSVSECFVTNIITNKSLPLVFRTFVESLNVFSRCFISCVLLLNVPPGCIFNNDHCKQYFFLPYVYLKMFVQFAWSFAGEFQNTLGASIVFVQCEKKYIDHAIIAQIAPYVLNQFANPFYLVFAGFANFFLEDMSL